VSKFPQTSFHNARDLISLAVDDPPSVIQRNGLYDFSPEWKRTLLQWFADNQDPETGLWGPKSKSGKLRKRDVNNSASILKAFLDREGNNLYPDFPVRYRDALFVSVLEDLSGPFPPEDNLPELHEWDLKTIKGLNLLIRYLWTGASAANRERAVDLIETYIALKFQKYYIPEEGAFSYYPNGDSATLDGISGFTIFTELGACSVRKRGKLWGGLEETLVELPVVPANGNEAGCLDSLASLPGVNSLRIYAAMPDPERLCAEVVAVVYPGESQILDFVDLHQKMSQWLEMTPMTMGNWISKAEMQERLDELDVDPAPVFNGTPLPEPARKLLEQTGSLMVIGYDRLQVPRYSCRIQFSET